MAIGSGLTGLAISEGTFLWIPYVLQEFKIQDYILKDKFPTANFKSTFLFKIKFMPTPLIW